ncbi:MAG TPA: hypothetical protein VF729_02850 [Solirubrobacterales bacterium]
MLAFVAIQHGMLAGQLERLDDRLLAAGAAVVAGRALWRQAPWTPRPVAIR